MTRLLLAGAVAVAGQFATAPAANADECTLKECCVYPYDGGWCVTPLPLPVEVNDVCVYPYDGGWCLSEVLP